MRYLWYYTPKFEKIIFKAKYGGSFRLCKFLGLELSESLCAKSKPCWDLIIPIPSSKETLRERGFLQTAIIAQQIAKKSKVEIKYNYLTHQNKVHIPQAGLSGPDRFQNMRDAFKINSSKVQGRNVLIVDDVITTGATITAASLALLHSGAASVSIMAPACSTLWQQTRKNLYNFQRQDLTQSNNNLLLCRPWTKAQKPLQNFATL